MTDFSHYSDFHDKTVPVTIITYMQLRFMPSEDIRRGRKAFSALLVIRKSSGNSHGVYRFSNSEAGFDRAKEVSGQRAARAVLMPRGSGGGRDQELLPVLVHNPVRRLAPARPGRAGLRVTELGLAHRALRLTAAGREHEIGRAHV